MSNEFESVAVPEPNIQYTQPKGRQGDGTVPHDHNYEDFKARAAARGIPESVGADCTEFLENEYEKWERDVVSLRLVRVGVWGAIKSIWSGTVRVANSDVITFAAEAFRIFRLEVKELSVCLAAELNDKRARAAQNDVGAAHIKHQQEMGEFHKFMMQHFEAQLDIGRARNQSLLDIAKGIMLEQKHKP
jgi:hypothetical protein